MVFSNAFLRSIIDLFFRKKKFFSQHEENIIKDIRNKELNYTAIIDIRNLFRLEKETKAIKDRMLRDTKTLFEHEEE